ncbi:Glutaredoxin [Candidatus Burarchaeum australiense]|nr:Glutaredoxin [Candidatus Burarchaeum australiense]
MLPAAVVLLLLAGCASQPGTQVPNVTNITNVTLPAASGSNFTLHVLYFYSFTCAYCARTTPLVDALAANYSAKNVVIHEYEIHNDVGKAIYERISDAYKIPPASRSVPVIFIDGEYLVGYPKITGYLEREINACLEAKCPNPLDALTNASIAVPV